MAAAEIITVAILPVVILIFIALRILGLKITWDFWHTLYSKKRFEALTNNAIKLDMKSFQTHSRNYTAISCIFGIGLLSFYSVYGHIGLLLWGVLALLACLYSRLSLYCTTQEDLESNARRRQSLQFSRYIVMISPLLVLLAIFFIPHASPLLDDYAIFNITGLIGLAVYVVATPFGIYKAAKKYFA